MKLLRWLSLPALSLVFITQSILFSNAQDVDDEDVSIEVTPEAVPDYEPPEGSETFKFEAEVSRMLDIVVNSLYKHKEVFLRELISNAADALDKYRYLSLTDESFKSSEDVDLEINIEFDKEAKTLTIRDTGVGMTKEDLVENLGTVARSGTAKFVEAMKASGDNDATIEQIGQFGVGFYSSFLVANRVTVASQHPKSPKQFVWESTNGASDFAIFEDPRGDTLKRGTEITLHLRDDASEYLNESRLRNLATHYSEFVTHPIKLRTTSTVEVEVEDEDDETTEEDTPKDETENLDDEAPTDEEKKDDDDLEIEEEDEEKPKKTKEVTTFSWETLNTNKAIWTRDKETISEDEYQNFFHLLNDNEYQNATTWSHFNAEGNVNFKSILFLPKDKPVSYAMGQIDEIPGAVRLYVRRVLIGDEFNLLPKYLGFMKGVVDSDELPLNVNRETLQEDKILKVIKKKLTKKAIELIRDFAKKHNEDPKKKDAEAEVSADGETDIKDETDDDEEDEYLTWYNKFSPNIKLGLIEDEPNRGKLVKLVRYQSSKSDGKFISLAEYVENMKDWQDNIYVLGGMNIEEVKRSPFLETFKEKDVEVIYMTDALDEYLVKHVRDYNGKKFVDVSSESVKFKDEDPDLQKRREKAYQKKFKPLTKWLKKLFGQSFLRVQVAKRSLGHMPAVVSSSEFGNSANMERIMKAQAFSSDHDMVMSSMRVLDINPRHPLIVKLLESAPSEDDDDDSAGPDSDAVDSAWMLHDMALLNGGYSVSDPVAHNKRMMKVLQSSLGIDSLELEEEIDPPVEDDEPPELDLDGMGGMNLDDFDMNMEDFNIGDDIDLDNL